MSTFKILVTIICVPGFIICTIAGQMLKKKHQKENDNILSDEEMQKKINDYNEKLAQEEFDGYDNNNDYSDDDYSEG